MKIIINSNMDNVNWGGQYISIVLDRELIAPNTFEGQLPESIEDFNKRNYFRKTFEVGSIINKDDYSKNKAECLIKIGKYIIKNWPFLDRKQWIKEIETA